MAITIAEKNRRYYLKHRSQLSKKRKRCYNKETSHQRWLLYMSKHGEKERERNKIRQRCVNNTPEANEKRRAAKRAWRLKNRSKDLERKKKYRQTHKEYRKRVTLSKEQRHSGYLKRRVKDPLYVTKDSWKRELKRWHPELRTARLALGAANRELNGTNRRQPLHPEAWQSLIEALKREAILPT